MAAPSKTKPSEERLLAIRDLAQANHQAAGSHPQIQGQGSYYGQPALKPPVWTWEIPLYFFIGGISGVSSCLAFFGQVFHLDSDVVRLLLWMGFVGAAICPMLLIADLGRPTRFLNMLRVFKIRSAMSLGAWILVAFSGCAFLGVAGNELVVHALGLPWSMWVRWLGEGSGAITGLLLASYTGVLIGATAIPVWNQNRRFLPAHFLTSGLGGASALVELAGYLIPATRILGLVTAGLETLYEFLFQFHRPQADGPLHQGKSGLWFRVAGLLEGPLALGVRIFWGSHPGGRYTAAVCFLLGSLLSRYAWIWAGRESAKQPEVEFAVQRSGQAKP
jgi:hypothetical protein